MDEEVSEKGGGKEKESKEEHDTRGSKITRGVNCICTIDSESSKKSVKTKEDPVCLLEGPQLDMVQFGSTHRVRPFFTSLSCSTTDFDFEKKKKERSNRNRFSSFSQLFGVFNFLRSEFFKVEKSKMLTSVR